MLRGVVAQDTLEAKSSAPSSVAARVFEEFGFGFGEFTAVIATSRGDYDVLADGVVEGVFSELASTFAQDSGFGALSYFNVVKAPFGMLGRPVTLARPLFVSRNNRSTVQLYQNWDQLTEWLQTYIDDRVGGDAKQRYSFGVTGVDELGDTDSSGARNGLAKMDSISIPVALVVLAWRVRSLPLIVIPLLSLVVSLLTAFSLLYQFSLSIDFPSFSPALFISTGVAICFDWCLFMLTRFREGVKAGKNNDSCVMEALAFAGHTVVMSGITLIVAYVALLAFPVSFITSIGTGAMVTMSACLVVNITLIPALLLAFPCFFRLEFSPACFKRTCRNGCGRPHGDVGVALSPPLLPGMAKPQLQATDNDSRAADVEVRSSLAYRYVTVVSKHPLLVVLATIVLFFPVSFFCSRFKITANNTAIHPRDTVRTVRAYLRLCLPCA